VLKVFYIYQVVTWLLGLIILIKEFFQLIFNNGSIEFLFVASLFILLACFSIFMNFCLLFNFQRRNFILFLNFNKWLMFIQICQISLIGFTAYFLAGIQLGLVYSYIDEQTINFTFKLFRFDIAFNCQSNSSILIAINFSPISNFYLVK
jgi:hypothetical protein